MKKKIIITLILLISFLTMAAAAEATVAMKQIPIYYNNVKVTVDGKTVSILPTNEPFIYANTTYVPLRVIAEALKTNVTWKADAKTVVIEQGGTTDVTSLKSQLTAKENEIISLKVQLAERDKKIKDLEEKTSDLNDLEKDLNKDYDELEDVEVEDIILDGDEDEVEVIIEVDLDDFDDEWEDLSDSDIEDWLDDLVNDIQDELGSTTEVEGEIINIDDDDEMLIEFSKDGRKSLDVDFEDDDYRDGGDGSDVADDLEGDRYYVDDIRFEIYSAEYYSSSDKVEIICDATTNDARDLWDDLSSKTIENEVENICEEIAELFDDENVDLETIEIEFNDEDLDLLDDFVYDVDDEELD